MGHSFYLCPPVDKAASLVYPQSLWYVSAFEDIPAHPLTPRTGAV